MIITNEQRIKITSNFDFKNTRDEQVQGIYHNSKSHYGRTYSEIQEHTEDALCFGQFLKQRKLATRKKMGTLPYYEGTDGQCFIITRNKSRVYEYRKKKKQNSRHAKHIDYVLLIERVNEDKAKNTYSLQIVKEIEL